MKNVLLRLAHYSKYKPPSTNYFSSIVLPTNSIYLSSRFMYYIVYFFFLSDESFDLNANDVQVIEDPISPEQSIHIEMKSSSEDSENR